MICVSWRCEIASNGLKRISPPVPSSIVPSSCRVPLTKIQPRSMRRFSLIGLSVEPSRADGERSPVTILGAEPYTG